LRDVLDSPCQLTQDPSQEGGRFVLVPAEIAIIVDADRGLIVVFIFAVVSDILHNVGKENCLAGTGNSVEPY